jgi:hypothetical protein
VPVAEIVDGRIAVRTQYHERHLVQQVPGARYDKDAGYWTAPLSWATCVLLRGLFGSELLAGIELSKWSWNVYHSRIEPAVHLRNAMVLSADDPIAHFIDLVESRAEGAGETA